MDPAEDRADSRAGWKRKRTHWFLRRHSYGFESSSERAERGGEGGGAGTKFRPGTY